MSKPKPKRYAPAKCKNGDSKKQQLKEASKGSDDDHDEPCVRCKFQHGDKNDPNVQDNWGICPRCKDWWHETCAAVSGSYRKKVFTCDQCTAKRCKN